MHKTAVAIAAALVLAGCGGDGNDLAESAPSATASARQTQSASASTRPSPTRIAAPTPSPRAVSVEEEAAVVARVLGASVAENRDALGDELVKSNSLVESQDELSFDQASRTLRVSVTSVFMSDTKDNRDTLAYDLATSFAPVYWGEEATGPVRPEATAALAVTVDQLTYTCPGPTVVALAERELNQAAFIEQCT